MSELVFEVTQESDGGYSARKSQATFSARRSPFDAMKLPRDLSGAELVEILCRRWIYRQIHQEGSHILIETLEPFLQRISVPAHRTLRLGTPHSILRPVARHKGIDRNEILRRS